MKKLTLVLALLIFSSPTHANSFLNNFCGKMKVHVERHMVAFVGHQNEVLANPKDQSLYVEISKTASELANATTAYNNICN